jgi:hypothetical protein
MVEFAVEYMFEQSAQIVFPVSGVIHEPLSAVVVEVVKPKLLRRTQLAFDVVAVAAVVGSAFFAAHFEFGSWVAVEFVVIQWR